MTNESKRKIEDIQELLEEGYGKEIIDMTPISEIFDSLVSVDGVLKNTEAMLAMFASCISTIAKAKTLICATESDIKISDIVTIVPKIMIDQNEEKGVAVISMETSFKKTGNPLLDLIVEALEDDYKRTEK